MVIIRFFFQPIRPIRDFQFDLYPAMHPGSLGTIITPASQILIPNSGFASGNGLEKLSRGKQGVFDRLGAEVHQRHAVAELGQEIGLSWSMELGGDHMRQVG